MRKLSFRPKERKVEQRRNKTIPNRTRDDVKTKQVPGHFDNLTLRQPLYKITKLNHTRTSQNEGNRGAQYLTGENLKVVWAEFSTLS